MWFKELYDGKFYRKPLYSMVKTTMFPLDFPANPLSGRYVERVFTASVCQCTLQDSSSGSSKTDAVEMVDHLPKKIW